MLRNEGDGTFDDVTAKAGLTGANLDFCFGVAAAIDNDGFSDLFICNAGRNALYHNNGDGTFTDVTVGSAFAEKPKDLLSVCAAWFDYNSDGLLDHVVSHTPSGTRQPIFVVFTTRRRSSTVIRRGTKACGTRFTGNEGNGRFKDVSVESGFAL